MFFYLSFLRPPPQSVYIALNGQGNSPAKSVEVILTPQIANDLRIAFLEESIDIFYAWIRVSPSSGPIVAIGQSNPTIDSFEFIEPKIKLTTWHVSSMYKALSVPFPHTAKRGQEWRLALFCQSAASGSNISLSQNSIDAIVVDLTKQNLGNLPFPVLSMPIKIQYDIHATSSKKTRGKSNTIPAKDSDKGKEAVIQTAKQSQIERLYLIPTSFVHTSDSSANPVMSVEPNLVNAWPPSTVICLREDTSFDLDKKVWDSGLMLGSWLSKLFVLHGQTKEVSDSLKTRLWKKIYVNPDEASRQIRVLELGCGTGIVSICFASLLHRFLPVQSERIAEVLASDQASAISIIERNISVNKHAFPSVDIKPLILDWDYDVLPPEAATPFDLVMMADVTYNTASFPSLVRTICNLVKRSDIASDILPVYQPYILLAYKQRDETERSLWDMLKEKGIVLTLIDKITAQCGGKDSGSGSGFGVDEEIEIWAWIP